MEKIKNENGPKLSNFVLGNTLRVRDNGLKPKEKRTTIGYLLPIEDEDNKEYVYDLMSREVYEIYDRQQNVEVEYFKIVNIPWEDSDEIVRNGIDEILEILDKYIEEYKEDKSKVKYVKSNDKVKKKKQLMLFYSGK